MNNNTQNPPSTSVSDISTHAQLIDLSLVLGSIAQSSSVFTDGLASYIEKLGKPLDDLSVTERV